MSAIPGIRGEFDYVLNYIKLVAYDGREYDFSGNFIEFSFEESVFMPYIQGSMHVLDAIDYPTLLPMLGEERLKVSFTRHDEKSSSPDLLPPIQFDMPIYRMEGRTQDLGSRKRQNYILRYVSDNIFTNLNVRIFKTYKNLPYSEMVADIHKTFFATSKPLDLGGQATQGSHTFAFQNISPFGAIRKLAQRSISNGDSGFYYVFYEDRDAFHFVPLSHLAKQAPVQTYTYQPQNISVDTPGQSHKPKNLDAQLYNFEDMAVSSNFDTLASARSGEKVSSILSVDPIRRKFSLKAFDLRGSSPNLPLVSNSKWEDFPHMEKAKPFIANSRAFINPLTNLTMVITDAGQDTQEYIQARDITVTPYNPEEFVLQTISHHQQLIKHRVKATVSGDPRIRAGQVVEFKLPEFLGKTSKQSPEEFDRYLQGKYLIIGISHVISRNNYRMNLEMIKDSFFSKIAPRDPVEIYENIF